MSYSVLIVDDEALTLRTMSRGLREEGFEVFTASSGEEALKIFAAEKPDLTLLYIVLPGVDGVEVLQQIKAAKPKISAPSGRIANVQNKASVTSWTSVLNSFAISTKRKVMMKKSKASNVQPR